MEINSYLAEVALVQFTNSCQLLTLNWAFQSIGCKIKIKTGILGWLHPSKEDSVMTWYNFISLLQYTEGAFGWAFPCFCFCQKPN
jgi:hypothetical protein